MTDGADAALAALIRGDLAVLYLRLDRDERVVELNRHTRDLLGPRAEGADFRSLVVKFDPAASPLASLRAAAGPRRMDFMTVVGLPQTYACSLVPLADGAIVVGGIDAVEQALVPRELVLSNQALSTMTRELQRANAELARLGALKSRFVGMAAHDLRSPLTALILYVSVLEGDFADDPTTRRDLAMMRATAEFMRRIIDDFLDVSIFDAGRFELHVSDASLDDIVAAAARIAAPVATRKGMALHIERSGADARARVDASRIQQVVMNLLNNAMEHSLPGDAVWLSTGSEAGRRFIRVRDEAGGISPELRESLFNAYVHGASKSSGARSTGLGLAIARLIVEAHRGTIDVVSSEAGSTFTVFVPAPE